MQSDKLLDDIGRQILRALQEDARISFSELGRRVGLSSPAVAERVRRMEEGGVIQGYRAMVSYERLGFPITAFIRVSTPASRMHEADLIAEKIPEVLECHHLTGTDCLILKVVVSSVGHLEEVINQMGHYGQTTTSIVLSSPVTSRILEPSMLDNAERP
ncbi:Lrp/AsnC family transcriptional regulator [Aminomonas paucivorans]|uniref:Transcriptional regulator, AsnC family n=1 Tax=Aminomonas paucivorans DSM 12260 TaxID=584708 RepID=E3CZ42_9BACT|nr:Lrp/AsnC family transcriptional regulator [Aminomonas paucivorans]EFQ22815.1 transcriptional regulator, AsnC family [Aminomonas paucivorans DSM 12260]